MKALPELNLPREYPWGIAIIDASSGRVLRVNACMRTIYGCEEGAALEEVCGFVTPGGFGRVVADLDKSKIWTGRINPRRSRHEIASVEVMLQCDPEDAGRIWLYTLEHPLVDKEVRFSSRSELKMLRVLLENTLEYVFFRDLDGHFILTNKAFREAVATDGRIPGVDTKIGDFFTPESTAWLEGLDEEVRDTASPAINKVAEVLFKNGIKHWLQLTTVPVRNGERETIGYLSVARDISDLKRTEDDLRTAIDRANHASRAKGQFLAAMSHEIRTPINGIIGASELCQETTLNREQEGYIETVVQCGNTLLSLVNDVLDFSKIEAGQLSLERLNFSPHTVMESVAEEFAQLTRAKDLELIVACAEEVPEFLMGDPTRLKQVLYNLVGNAVKFTNRGDIVLRAEVMQIESKSARIRFAVQDTGIGIDSSRLDAIFESFTQADMSTSRRYGGTGLGLTICRELVRLMGGEIGVTSRAGEGSCFFFELPFERTELIGAESVPFNPELAGIRVLIVDDNPTNREIYSQMCARWGYRSATAADGVSGLKQMEDAVREDDRFKLVMLDQQMPGMTGLELASVMKSKSSLRACKVILLSSSLDREEALQAAEVGVDRALSKPVKRATLLEVILETFEIGEKGEPQSAAAGAAEAPPTTPMSILLVEDNPVNQTVASKRLTKLGHTVTLASDGNVAVEKVEHASFDGILMDIQMPGMDGYEATERIRELEETRGIARHWIVAMTAHAMKGDEQRCLDVGMDDYIAKPFRVKNLKEVLRRMERAIREKVDPGKEESGENAPDLEAFLAHLSEEDREDRMAAAEIFVQTLPGELEKLNGALEAGDREQLYFMAHSLKSVAGVFGAPRSVSLAKAIEEQTKSEAGAGQVKETGQLVEQFGQSLRELSEEIERVREAQGS